jgi:hypothetical protein
MVEGNGSSPAHRNERRLRRVRRMCRSREQRDPVAEILDGFLDAQNR